MVDLSARLSALPLAQRAALLRKLGLPADETTPLPRAIALRSVLAPTVSDPARTITDYPADPGLLPFWFLHHFALPEPVYNSPFAFRLRGQLEITALGRALGAVVARHETLRSSFALNDNGALVQRVASSAEFVLDVAELCGAGPSAGLELAAEAELAALARTTFDVANGPLFRIRLLRLGPEEHILGIVFHHLIYDGWSRANFYRDLAALYVDASALQPPLLPYHDYTAGRLQRLASPAATADRAFWKGLFADTTTLGQLPCEPSKAVSFGGECIRFTVQPSLWRSLQERARNEGTTLFALVFTAYLACLRRHSAATDLCVGVPTAGRSRPESEALIGCFIRMLALRVSLPGDPTLRELLAEVSRVAAAASQHQELTPESIGELSSGRGPIFQTLFALQNFPRGELRLSDQISVDPLPLPAATSKLDLSLSLEPRSDSEGGATALLAHNPRRFSPDRARRFLTDWIDCLRELVAAPDSRVSTLAPSDLVCWHDSAHRLLARLCTLDDHQARTYLVPLRVDTGRGTFAVSRAAVLPLFDGQPRPTPGALLAITPQHLLVAAADAVLALETLQTLGGDALTTAACAHQFTLHVGDILPSRQPGSSLSPNLNAEPALAALASVPENYSSYEASWAKRWAELLPLPFPDLGSPAIDPSEKPVALVLPWSAPNTFSASLPSLAPSAEREELLIAGLVAFLARETGRTEFDIAWFEAADPDTVSGGDLFVAGLPLRANLSRTADLFGLVADLRSRLAELRHSALLARREISLRPALRGKGGPAELPIQVTSARTGLAPLVPGTLRWTLPTADEVGTLTFFPQDIAPASASRLRDRCQHVLGQLLRPDAPALGALELLPPDEHTLAVHNFNQSAADLGPPANIEDLIATRAALSPDAIAVQTEAGDALTYCDLLARADALALRLRAEGVGPAVIVALFLPRSPDLIIALLGVLRAGGAFLPLDPELPDARRARILEDARPLLVLAKQADAARFPASTRLLDPSASATPATELAAWPPSSPASVADRLAYVIYTSGTTGRPKGVVVGQRSLVNHARACVARFALKPDDHVLQFASIAFDASIEEIFPCLITGARLVLRSDAMIADPAVFLRACERLSITVLDLPTAFWSLLADQCESDRLAFPPTLRLVIIGGARATRAALARWRHLRTVRPRLLNTYGPTEATVIATWADLTDAPLDEEPPIGLPLPNVTAHVLDSFLRPVPFDAIGELFIGGVALAHGYLGSPDLTAARFFPDPFSPTLGARLYRTGDLARRRKDGQLIFCGRTDSQVKIRGFRVEPEEIEAVLSTHPALAAAAVVVRLGSDDTPELAAFAVARSGSSSLSSSALRAWLTERLPSAFVPVRLVFLPALPLTVSDKIDRRALTAYPIEADTDSGQSVKTAPRMPTEQTIAEVWADLLRLPEVGVHDDFFQLGGHSLLAMQVVARLRRLLAVELPIKLLFEYPTIAGLVTHLPSLAGAATLPPLSSVPRDRPIEMSFAQQRLWFLDRLEGGSTEYHMPSGLSLRGALKVEALEQSLGVLVARHESLRTSFPEGNDGPAQSIADTVPFALAFTDLSGLDPEARAAALAQAQRAEHTLPFDLAKGPLFRARLLRLSADEHALLFTTHHIISDGWSQRVLQRELASLYRAFVSKEPSPLATLRLQYADYAAWQRTWLHGAELERQLGYWREHLKAPTTLELPTDHPRPAVLGHAGARVSFTLPENLSAQLVAFGRAEGVTPFMSLLAVFQILLFRYSGQEDILVGTPIANRPLDELEGIVGFFANTLVLRGDLSGQPTFREVVARVRANALQAYAHQDLPFEKLVEALNPPRDLSRHPLFQVSFAVQNLTASEDKWLGLKAEQLESTAVTTHFDLGIQFTSNGPIWKGSVSYRTDLFDADTMTRFVAHFETLLRGCVVEVTLPVSKVQILTPLEHHELLVKWNTTGTDYPHRKCIHELFEEQVVRTPEAIAVVYEGNSLTYRELNTRANQLAHYLRRLAIGPDSLVLLLTERSIEFVVGMFAILKAGGAYVPLDPTLPDERVSGIISDTDAKAIITQSQLAQRLQQITIPVFKLDSDWPVLGGMSVEDPENDTRPANLAYVIFTSGSTGRPKGVLNEHQNLVNYVAGIIKRLSLHSGWRFAVVSTFAADLGHTVVFPALTTGGQLHIIGADISLDSGALARYFSEQKIDVVKIVPSHLAMLLQAASPELAPDLMPGRILVLGGESSDRKLISRLRSLAPNCRIFNHYGPTETTVGVLTHEITDLHQPKRNALIPLGRPLANTRVYVVDSHLQPAPVGVAGELLIGGAGVARGYLNRPNETQKSFISDPFGGSPTARCYKTGDRGRWLRDGTIEFLGRTDYQVKVRGYRIELGEIETFLGHYPNVARCTVIVREDKQDDKRLVAYVTVAEPAAPPSASLLREYLAQRLPDYMVPSAFVFLDALPLTANGKIDRRALPAPATLAPHQAYSALGADDTAGDPRTALERDLAVLWADSLGRPRVGREENFFAIGGHSLLAARISSSLLRRTGRRLPIAVFFTAPTIGAMAAWLDAAPDAPVSRALVILQSKGDAPALFCIHGYGGDAYVYLPLAKDLAPDRPLVGVQAIGLDGRRPRHTTVEQMAAHYADEIIAHQPTGPYHLLGFSAGGWMAYALAQELRARGATVGLLAVLDTHANARLPLHLHLWESINQGCKRAVSRWQERDAFVGRLRALPFRRLLPHLLGRFRHLCGRRTKALPTIVADELAPPPLRRALRDPDKSPEYYFVAVTRYSAKPYTGDLVIFSSQPERYFRWSFWPRLVRGRVVIEPAQGEHIDLLEPENTPSLAVSLRRLLAANDGISREMSRIAATPRSVWRVG